MRRHTLGSYLKEGRLNAGLSHTEVARKLRIKSVRHVAAWERNRGDVLPLKILKRLIRLYSLDPQMVLDLLLQYQLTRLEEKWNRLMKKRS